MPRHPNETKQTQFRLPPTALVDLGRIKEHLEANAPGVTFTRTDAILYAIAEAVNNLPKKSRKKSPESA